METEKKRLTATEREALMRIDLARRILCAEDENIKRRTKMIYHGTQMLSSARGLLERYVREAFKTIPIEQLKAVARSVEDTTYTIGVRCNSTMNNDRKRNEEYGVVVPIGTLSVLLTCCQDHCIVCGLDTEGERRCELRKAIDTIPNDKPDQDNGGCPYRYAMIMAGGGGDENG